MTAEILDVIIVTKRGDGMPRIYNNDSQKLSPTKEAGTYKARGEKQQNNKSRISDSNPVDFVRSYGVTKKEYPLLEKIKSIAIMAVTVLFMLLIMSFVVIGIVAFLFSGQLLIQIIMITVALMVLIIRLTRSIRKRLIFHIKLRKLCKKEKFRLKFERKFFQSLVWSPDKIDFTLSTGTHVYAVHYLTLNKYNATLNFFDKGEIIYKKQPRNNKFSVIFDRRVKSKTYKISFPEKYDIKGKKNIHALVVNPTCREFFKKDETGGGVVPSGSGECVFGMTVYTGSGFIASIIRNEAQD